VWAQEESRCGVLPIVRPRLPARGGQPVLACAYHFASLSLYGAVEPRTGKSFFLELPALNTEGFPLFLAHCAATDPLPSHLLLLDNGAFHKAQALPLPPMSVRSPFLPTPLNSLPSNASGSGLTH
jgi:hypothetical protein